MGLLDEKKRDNIASYVISMWHVEDLMRANAFDLNKVEELLIAPMDADERSKEEVRAWYTGIIHRMKEQGLERRGHLSEVEEVINELEFLHRTLDEVMNDQEYDALYEAAKPAISELQRQADDQAEGPITTCFTAIYGVMLLRAQGKEVSASTAEAETQMRKMLEYLSYHYKMMRKLPGISMN
ncbi:MAG TPA: DUF4924 family protein [Flavobacteriales bacterium]|jgi:hypothetical protein|nr:DUF4924 family protein [Flavobacteriales bacterium]